MPDASPPDAASPSSRTFWRALGPGLLFAGAAVGVSHLVQSTRAGAVHGLALIGVVLLANLVKFPAFAMGPRYAAATGTSLLEGYRRQGRWALAVYALLTLGTMFTVEAAVTIVTAGLAKAVLPGLPGSVVVWSAIIVAACAALTYAGHYRVLDRIVKVTVVTLTLCTLAATALVIPRIDWATFALWPDTATWPDSHWFFVAALVGWMPSAVDISVWHSLWTLARAKDSGHRPSVRDAMTDFGVGYIGTAALACCFVMLGAALMHGRGLTFPDAAPAFAAQLVALYTEALGDWAAPLIGVSAFAVMVSTTLTVVDAFPRALAVLWARLRHGAEAPVGTAGADSADTSPGFRRAYAIGLWVLGLGSVALIGLYAKGLKPLIDLATTLSFLTAPLLAWLNHRAVLGPEVPPEGRPGPVLKALSALGIVALGAAALGWLWLRFGSGA